MPYSKPVQLQPRDKKFIAALNAFDGVLAARQVKDQFYPNISQDTFRNRLVKLKNYNYIHYTTPQTHMAYPVPEKVCWLDVRGIAEVAQQQGIPIDFPEKLNETALRTFTTALRKQGIRWKREPSWYRLKHHIAVCDTRLIIRAAAEKAGLIWGQWIPESKFWAHKDYVTYTVTKRDRYGEEKETEAKSAVIPDGFFTVSRSFPGQPNKRKWLAFLVEVDMGTEDQPRIQLEKIIRGEAYLASAAFKERTKLRYGRWLLITTGQRRAANMKSKAEAVTNSKDFYFTDFDQLSDQTFFTAPFWYLLGKAEPLPLLPPSRP